MADFDPSGGGIGAVGRVLATGYALDIFFTGSDGIFQTWYSPSGWNTAPGAPSTLLVPLLGAANASQPFPHAPSVVSWQPDRLDLFAVSSSGDLWHFWADDESQPQTSWSSESLGHPSAGALDSAPSAVTQDVDKITVFVRAGSQGTLFACVWDPANGQRWNWHTALEIGWAVQPRGYAFSPATGSWAPDRIDLFGITGSADGGTLEHTWQQDFPGDPHWHPSYWEAAGTIAATSSPVAVSWLDQQQTQQITVVYCGPSGIEGSTVAMTRWLGDHWLSEVLYQQVSAGDGIAGFPALASWQAGRLDSFWIRSDYSLQHGWNDSGGDVAGWSWENFTLQPA